MTDISHNLAYAVGSVYADGAAMPPSLDLASAVTGAIANTDPDQPINFRFNYGEITMLGNITPKAGSYELSVNATVGHIPYTAENRATRALLQAGINKLHHATNGAIHLNGQQAIIVRGDKSIEPPFTAVTIMSGLVSLMVQIRPLFKAVGEFLPDVIGALPAKAQE